VPEAAAKPPPDKSRRAVVIATVGIAGIIGLALLYLATIAPLRHTHAVLRDTFNSIGRIRDKDMQFKKAIKRLGGPKSAAERLARYLRLPEWATTNARKQNAIYLLRSCGEWAVPPLTEMLDESKRDFYRCACSSLRFIGPNAKEAVPALVKGLSSTDAYVRVSAVSPLGRIGPEARAAVPALVKALEDSDADVRRLAAWALGEIGPEDPETLSALEKVLKDADPNVRNSATMTLKKIRGSAPAPDAPSEVP